MRRGSSGAEHFHGKEGVGGSNPLLGSNCFKYSAGVAQLAEQRYRKP